MRLRAGILYFISFFSAVFLISKGEFKKSKFLVQNPGWIEQYQAMKNLDPNYNYMALRSTWNKQDKLNKKSSGALNAITEMGPDKVGGRVRALLIDASDSLHLFAGGISGGLWTSNNGGKTWSPINELASSMAVSCITQNPFNPKEIYYGTGESLGNSADINGAGVFKSVDGGKTFVQLEASTQIATFNTIWDIEYSKTDSSTFYVGTAGGGLYRSTDNGLTFNRVYNASKAIHEILTYKDSTIWFGVEANKLMTATEKSTMVFTQITGGLPSSGFGRISMDYSSKFPNVAYCQMVNGSGTALIGIYKTSDHGKTWKKLTSPSSTAYSWAWYCLATGVSRTDTNFVFALGVKAYSSSNGGSTWTELKASHADFHSFQFYSSGKNFLIGNDGGVYSFKTQTATTANVSLNNGLNITQFYTGNYKTTDSKVFIGGTQDNGTIYYNSNTFSSVHGGDGAYCAISTTSPFYTYVSSQNGELRRKNQNFAGETNIKPTGSFWFINPFEMNPLDGNQLFVLAKNKLISSSNSGTTWVDLTKSLNKTILSMGMSYEINPTVYCGGGGNTLYRCSNANTTKQVEVDLTNTAPALATGSVINSIKVSHQDTNTIYLSMSDASSKPKVWKLNNAESANPTWVNISGNLPVSLPVNCIEVCSKDSNKLVAGTDFGLYSTNDGGLNWSKELAVPNVPIFKLVSHPQNGVLYIFTHGRGVFKSQFSDFDATVDIESLKSKLARVTFNNPVDNSLNLNLGDEKAIASIALINSAGVKVYSNYVHGQSTMDISNLKSGIYILTITINNQTLSRKLLKI